MSFTTVTKLSVLLKINSSYQIGNFRTQCALRKLTVAFSLVQSFVRIIKTFHKFKRSEYDLAPYLNPWRKRWRQISIKLNTCLVKHRFKVRHGPNSSILMYLFPILKSPERAISAQHCSGKYSKPSEGSQTKTLNSDLSS